MTTSRTHKPMLLALSLAAALAMGAAHAQEPSKQERHDQMAALAAQIDALKGQGGAEALAQVQDLSNQLRAISVSLGGDLPCATGEVQAGSSATRAPAPSPTGCVASTVSVTNNTPVPLVDLGVVTSTIVVAGAQPYIWDVDVTTFLQHTFAADIDMTITSPSGTVVTLTTDNGAGNDDVFNGTVWDDSANPGGQVPYTSNNGLVTDHVYANLVLASPLVPEEALAAFVGEDPNGVWTLTISDDLGGDTGTLNSWSLDITTFAAAPVLNPVQSFINNTPVAIPTGPGVVSSTIAVAGLSAPICKLVARTTMPHTFAADLDVTLMSPAGTIVTLTTDNGAGNDNVFAGTVWDDQANPGGQVPYVTNNGVTTDHAYVNLVLASPLVPEEAMGAFLGQDGNGTWTLTISDDLAGDGGSLDTWQLDITTCSCASADLSVTLTDNPDPVLAGNNLTLTATAQTGAAAADDVEIDMTLPAGVSFVSVTPSAGGICTGTGPVNCAWAGSTPANSTRTATVVVGVPPGTADGTILNSSAVVSSTTPDPDPTNNTALATTTVQARADLSITLTDTPDPVTAGTNLTYTATVTQGGPSDAQNVAFSLPLPAGTTLVSSTPSAGGACAGAATVTCTWAGLSATGAVRSATIVVLVGAGVANGTNLSATATATSTTGDQNPANNVATATTTVNASANLALTLTASTAAAELGEPVTFTADLVNLGPSAAQDVQIAMTLSPDFRFSSVAPSAGGVCTSPQIGLSGVVTCTWAGATAPNGTRSMAVVAVSNSPGNSSIQATASSLTSDPVVANNSASVTVLVGNPVEAIPTMGRYGLVLLGLMLGLLGFVALRQRV